MASCCGRRDEYILKEKRLMTAGSACARGMPTHQPHTKLRQLLSMQDWLPEFYLLKR